MDHVNAWNWKVSLSWDERDTEYPDLLDWEMCVVNHRLFMPYNILGCYITGLYMTFNQCQFLLSTSPLCVDIVVLDMHPSRLGDWSCLARNQQAMAWQHMDGILSHKLQSLSGAPKSPPHNNKSHPQLISWAVCCWRIAGRAFLCQIYTVYRGWWSIPYYYGKAAQTSPFPATMKWGSYSDKVRCRSCGVW